MSLLSNLAIYALSAAAAVLAVGGQGGDWLVAVPAIVVLAFAGGVRLYVLQHDLGHLSLFETKAQNRFWGGYVVSPPLTFAAYPQMTYNHNLHHAYVGDLNERHTTEIYTMTVREWEQARFWERLYYRFYRHPPAVLIPPVGGSFWTYFFVYRWPKNAAKVGGVKAILAHNLAILAVFAALYAWQGWSGVLTFAFAIWLGGAASAWRWSTCSTISKAPGGIAARIWISNAPRSRRILPGFRLGL